MKLFLTSAGFTNQEIAREFLAQLPFPVGQSRVLIVAYAQNPEEEFYVNESKKEIQQLGFENIVIANMHHPVDVSSLGDFSVIYVCGGNTFAILQKLRETGLSAFIIQQVQAGAVYVGVSAGSIIAGPSIEIASWGSEGDENKISLEDLSGFNLVDLTVFPHFHEELRSEIEEFKKKVSYRVFELTNDQAIFVNDSEVTLFGGTSGSFMLAQQYLGKEVEVIMDRPLGSKHPKHGFVYEANYGYLLGVLAPDGEDLDAYYLGVQEPLERASGVCIAIAHRKNNDDDKLVVVPSGFEMTDEQIMSSIHFQEQWFDTEIVRKV